MRKFTGVTVWWLTVALTACHDATPSSPTATTPTSTPAGGTVAGVCASPPYTISGIISAAGDGPLSGAMVQLVPYPYGAGASARTDASGQYSLCGPSASKVALQVWRDGFATAFKYSLPAQPQSVNLALRPKFQIGMGGGMASGEILGDEFEAGDDEFGGVCKEVPCKVVDFSIENCPCHRSTAEITLRSLTPSARLGLYFSNTDVYFPPATVPPATRYCCDSPMSAVYHFNADFDRFAIGFEAIGDRPPGLGDRVSFEISVRPE